MNIAGRRKSPTDTYPRMLSRPPSANGCLRAKDALRGASPIVQVGLTERRAINAPLTKKAQPEKHVNTFTAWLRVVRLSPALPGRLAWDAPSLSLHPHCYGMEPASPGRLSFRASAFASAPDVSELTPQNPVSPARWWSAPRPRRRQWLHHRSPSTG